MILSTAIELIVIGLVAWQLIVVRRSIRADRETANRTRQESDSPTGTDKSSGNA